VTVEKWPASGKALEVPVGENKSTTLLRTPLKPALHGLIEMIDSLDERIEGIRQRGKLGPYRPRN
jgi:hypothetical protein